MSLTIVLSASLSALHAGESNLLNNPGFEDTQSKGAGWGKIALDKNPSTTLFGKDPSVKHSGSVSMTILNKGPNDSRFGQQVSLKAHTSYRFSCWVKTKNVGSRATGANLSILGITNQSQDVKGTTPDWQYLEMVFNTGSAASSAVLTVGLGGYQSPNTGQTWFDDAALIEITGENQSTIPGSTDKPSSYSGIQDAGTSEQGKMAPVILLAVIFAFTAAIVLGVLRKKMLTGDTLPGTTTETASNRSLDKKDIILMGTMTLIYLVIAFINLGSTSVPQTGWTPSQAGESVTFDTGRQAQLSRIYFYFGEGTGEYKVEQLSTNNSFQPVVTFEQKDYLNWKSAYLDINAWTRQVRVTVNRPGGTINEIALAESGQNTMISGLHIAEKSVSSQDKGAVENLIDENDRLEYRPSYLKTMIFDEIYHGRTAYDYTAGNKPFDNSHPPLGKVFIAIGIALFGMNPFGWRLMGTLFGAAMIPLMYLFGRKLFGGRFYAFSAAFLLMFDFMHFTQTRVGTIDSYPAFFVLLCYYFFIDFYRAKSYETGYKASLKPLFLSGLFFGLGIATKWIALYSAGGLALLFFWNKLSEYKDYRNALKDKRAKLPWVRDYIPVYGIKTALYCALFFIVIPIVIYLASYWPFFRVYGFSRGLSEIMTNQAFMLNLHSSLRDVNALASPWWSWPFITTPMCYVSTIDPVLRKASSIVAMGNPAIWWTGVAALIAGSVIAWRRKDKTFTALLIAIAFQYLPWAFLSDRTTYFIYHFLSVVPFLILIIVYCIKVLLDKYPQTRYLVIVYLAVSAILFMMFYPVLSGLPVDINYVESWLRWFRNWTLIPV